jgi:PIN domain nuclease of toxin-antitoxin system
VRLLIDTATFIWATGSPERISKVAAAALEPGDVLVEVSAISLTEIAIKHTKGKLALPKSIVQAGIDDFRLRVLPFTANHAYQLFGLPPHHNDPFDRMIIAQALAEGIPIVTSDDKFRLYKELRVVW